jgi:DNA-binding transcriptional ArsR family regulator
MHMPVFAALADPTRLRIVEALRAAGEQPVGELVGRVAIHQSGVSRHLRILHGAGLVQVRPSGPQRLYSLRPEPFQELDAWLGGYRRLWEARLERLGRALEARRKARRPRHGGMA